MLQTPQNPFREIASAREVLFSFPTVQRKGKRYTTGSLAESKPAARCLHHRAPPVSPSSSCSSSFSRPPTPSCPRAARRFTWPTRHRSRVSLIISHTIQHNTYNDRFTIVTRDIHTPPRCSSLLPSPHPFLSPHTPSTNPTRYTTHPFCPNISNSSLIDGRVLQRDLLIRDLEPPPQPPDHRLMYKEDGEKKEGKRVRERGNTGENCGIR